MIVISDTTPIISLLKANHLELLQKLYGNVLIMNAVECLAYWDCRYFYRNRKLKEIYI